MYTSQAAPNSWLRYLFICGNLLHKEIDVSALVDDLIPKGSRARRCCGAGAAWGFEERKSSSSSPLFFHLIYHLPPILMSSSSGQVIGSVYKRWWHSWIGFVFRRHLLWAWFHFYPKSKRQFPSVNVTSLGPIKKESVGALPPICSNYPHRIEAWIFWAGARPQTEKFHTVRLSRSIQSPLEFIFLSFFLFF